MQITAVYSRTRRSAETVAETIPYEVDVYTDIGAVLADERIEAVDIVLPIPMLPEVVSQALAAGKHVFSEKPIAQTVGEAQTLIAASRSYGDQVWMVGENWRYEEAFQEAARAVQAGRIGQPLICDLSLQLLDKGRLSGGDLAEFGRGAGRLSAGWRRASCGRSARAAGGDRECVRVDSVAAGGSAAGRHDGHGATASVTVLWAPI